MLACYLMFACCGRSTTDHTTDPETDALTGTVAQTELSSENNTTPSETVNEEPVVQQTSAQMPSETLPATTTPDTVAVVSEEPADSEQKSCVITTNGGTEIELSQLRYQTDAENAPAVYLTKEISADALISLYQALPYELTGKIAVKLSTGESAASNYLEPSLIGGLVQMLNASIAECMTAYGGVRSVAALHKQVAVDRGYTAIAPFDLLDESGEFEIPYNGTRINRAIVGDHIRNYDGILVLSHFKGHTMAGFGGAIKNVGIGISGRTGKIYVHSAGTRTVGTILHSDQKAWLEALAETVKAISDYENYGKNMLYISVMNRLSVDCDCTALPAQPDMHDIGMLASYDPVALDQACVDLVYAVPDGHSLIRRMESRLGEHVLEHAESIGLGSRMYRLISVDTP